MAKSGAKKTNVLRLLDAAGIQYTVKEYPADEPDLSALRAAEKPGMPAERVFKTLVLRGGSGVCRLCSSPGILSGSPGPARRI
jgi:Cys-tRNA(Pro)/Cys-tRNA(Cys) deacylase